MENKIVQVTWEDITSQPGWVDEEDTDIETCSCISVGILINKTKTHVTIGQTFADAGMWGNVKKIPMGVVRKIKVLK